MKNEKTFPILLLTASMVIFGTVGVVRRSLTLPSAVLAGARGMIGVICILIFMLITGKKPDCAAIRKSLVPLMLSGCAITVNWVLLFEAYKYTSVAVATMCYYMAPVFVMAASPAVLKEKLRPHHLICIAVSVAGMALITLDGSSSGGIKGVILGLGAAVFYACVILLNKKLTAVPAIDRTLVQLACAAVSILPYALITSVGPLSADTSDILLLIVLGAVHTGAAYVMYFSAVGRLPAPTVAVFGYIDPAVAVILSATFLNEPLSAMQIAGMICILGSVAAAELLF